MKGTKFSGAVFATLTLVMRESRGNEVITGDVIVLEETVN